MSDAYHQLLSATIRHLTELRAQGVHYVPVSPVTLNALNGAAPTATHPAPQRTASLSSQPAPQKPALAPPPHPHAASLPPTPILVSETKPVRTNPGPVLEKSAAYAALRQRALACGRCTHLAASRKNVVLGAGNLNARLMFIGEAPGAHDDERGEPFADKPGQLLTKIIQTMGLTRDTVYITCIVKCRPDTPGEPDGSRKPTAAEIQTCLPFLQEQIDLIQPGVLVALGATATEGLLGKTAGITRLRGQWQSYRGIPLMPTYHPAYLLHNEVLSHKRLVWEDMLQVMTRLGMPVTEKQRGYFLKA